MRAGPCASDAQVLAFVEAQMDAVERASLERHISSCEECSDLVAAVATEMLIKIDSSADKLPGLVVGQHIGPYVVVEFAGRGSMGEVYRARDPRLERDVAIKMLSLRLAHDPELLARFQVEARATSGIAHANTLTVYDVGSHESVPYLVTEWLVGMTLRHRLALGPLPVEEILQIGMEVSQGLAAAHAKGIIHRDLKPSNLFLCNDGSSKILDFGLARFALPFVDQEGTQPGTRPGMPLGTPGYMSPEQVRGQAVDERTDLFSLGAVLGEMATGSPIFAGDSPVERMSSILHDDIPAMAGELGALISRCLVKDVEARFQSAQDLAFHLSLLKERSTSSLTMQPHGDHNHHKNHRWRRKIRRPGMIIATMALALCSAIVAIVLSSSEATVRPAEHPIYRPFTFERGHILSARFGSRGQTIVYGAAWDGNPVQLFSAQTQRPGSTALGIGADVLSVSNRGELALQLQPGFLDSTFGVGTLARRFLSGGAPRVVLDDVLEAQWIPDTSELAVLRKVGGRFQIEVPIGTLRYETEGRISHFRISPHGEGIAFLLHHDPKDDAGAVAWLDNSGTFRELSSGWSSTRGLAWAPAEPSEIWFSASQGGDDYQVFAVNLHGELRLVDRVPGRVVLQDIAEDGKVLLDHQIKRIGLTVGHDGKERDLTWSETSFLADLSLDGSTVLFVESGASEGANYGVYLRPTDGGPPTRLGEGMPLALSPDGQSVLTLQHTPPIALALLPRGTGSARDIDIGPLSMILAARFFPDGQRVLLRANEEGRAARLWIHHLEHGDLKPITPEGVDPSVAISPSGERLVGIDATGTLRIYAAEGNELDQVPGSFPMHKVVGWVYEEDAIYMRTLSLPVEITRVDLKSGSVTPYMTLPAGPARPGIVSVLTLYFSADGRTYAYCDSQTLSKLYVVEGLAGSP